jgi:hypothetical protein
VYVGSGGAAGDLVIRGWELGVRLLGGEDPATFQPCHGDAQPEDGDITSSPPSQALRSGREQQWQLWVKAPRLAVNRTQGYYGTTRRCVICTHLNANAVTEYCIIQKHESS